MGETAETRGREAHPMASASPRAAQQHVRPKAYETYPHHDSGVYPCLPEGVAHAMRRHMCNAQASALRSLHRHPLPI